MTVSVSDALQISDCGFAVILNGIEPWQVICPLDVQEIVGADCPAYTPDVTVLVGIEGGNCWQGQPFSITQDPATGTPLANGLHQILLTITGPDGSIEYCELPILVDCPALPPDPCINLVNSIPLHTGVNPVDGTLYPFFAVDPLWTVTGDPDPGTIEPRPAFVIPQYPFGWLAALLGSRWLNAYATFANTLNGTYELETSFCLAPGWSGALLDIQLRADDWAEVYLNGTLIGSTPNPSFNTATPTSIIESNQTLFQTGTNVLRVNLINSGGVAMGLNLAGTISADGLSLEDPLCCNPRLSISGQKFFDTNQDGIFNPGEPVLAGWAIEASDGLNTYTTTTDSNGYYYFMNLPAGTYTVSEVQQPGYAQTAPSSGSHSVTLVVGQSVAGLNFGNYRVEVIPNEPPLIECPGDVMIDCAPASGISVSLTASFIDPDGDPLSYSWFVDGSLYTSGGIAAGGPPTVGSSTITPLLAPGVYNVSVSVSDGAAEAACNFTVTVTEARPPRLLCRNQGLLTLPVGKDCEAILPLMPYAIIPGCTPVGSLLVNQIPAQGTALPTGSHWVTIEVFDPASGQSIWCRFQVQVADQTPPSLVCPQLDPIPDCDAVIPDLSTLISVTDNCDPLNQITILQIPAAGTPVGAGSHSITITAIDSAGNVAQCSSILQVQPAGSLAQPLALFNTGRNPDNTPLAPLAIDPHYILTSSASVNFPGPDTYASNPIVEAWIPNNNSPDSLWISPQPFANVRITSGQYVYTQTFTVPANASGANISGRWLTDNSAELRLNGVPTGHTKPANGFSAWSTFVINSGFIPGTNTLEFVVNALPSSGGADFYSGLRVELQGESYACDPSCILPTAQVLPALAQTGVVGGSVTFTAVTSGTPPLALQWFFNGVPIPNATGQTLTVSPLSLLDSGAYSVSATNACGSAMSRAARLRVLRGWIDSGDKWTFDGSATLQGQLGTRIEFIDPDDAEQSTYSWTHFGLSSDFNIPGPDGIPVSVMRFARTAAGNGYQLSTDATQRVQSFAFDIFLPAELAGAWIPLLHFNYGQSSDADVYLLATADSAGDLPGCPLIPVMVEQWQRILVSVDFSSGDLRAYLNGQAILACSIAVSESSRDRSAIVRLFSDAGEYPFLGYLSSLAWFKTGFDDFSAASLGASSAAGFSIADPQRKPPQLTLRNVDGDLSVLWRGDGLGLEYSFDLHHWLPLPILPELDESGSEPVFELRIPMPDSTDPWFLRGDAF